MAEVHQAAAGGKGAVALDFRDHEAVRAWLRELRVQLDEVVAAGEDATRSPGQRALGRAAARGAILEARDALGQMMSAAERGLRAT